jgi:adenylate cyclase
MAEESFKRKLTAVFSADVAGYSRLMGEDEAETVKTLTAYRKIMGELIQQHRGRVIDSPGDNILAEFGSVVDAVQCGVAAQNEFKARNAALPENRHMEFRIGVNLGDVIEEENRIYGDGVNIAARLESLADPGGICISKTAFDHIESKLPLGYEYLGEQEVKNIAKPVGAYRVLMEPRVIVADVKAKKKAVPLWRRKSIVAGGVAIALVVIAALIWNFYFRGPTVEPASVEKMAYPLPDKPSIAVLPFDNLSGDPEQEYFSDGVTEEIISALSKLEKLFVIAKNSTFTYKSKPVKVQQVSEELGVRYVLEGSVKKSENRVRITAQLIDALTGRHLWAERYDRDLKDIFALQDEITKKIITALQVKLTEGEQATIHARGTRSLEVYLKVLQGRDLARHQNIEDNLKARQILEEALELDPNYAPTYRWLGGTHLMDVWLGSTKSPRDSLRRAVELSKKGLSIDNSLGDSHGLLGSIYVLTKQYEKGLPELRKAADLDPNGADAHAHLAMGLLFMDKSEEGILISKKAIRLNPMAPSWYLHNLAGIYRNIRNYEEALKWAEKAVKQEPKNILSRLVLCSIYSLMGRTEEARGEADEVMKLNPKFSLKRFEKTLPYKNVEPKNRYIEALSKAGLK